MRVFRISIKTSTSRCWSFFSAKGCKYARSSVHILCGHAQFWRWITGGATVEAFAFASSAGLGAGRRRKIVARTSKLLCLCGSPGAIHRRKSSSVSWELSCLPPSRRELLLLFLFILIQSRARGQFACCFWSRARCVCASAGLKRSCRCWPREKRGNHLRQPSSLSPCVFVCAPRCCVWLIKNLAPGACLRMK